jgi:hypothetical protein
MHNNNWNSEGPSDPLPKPGLRAFVGVLSLCSGTVLRGPFEIFDAPDSYMLSVDDIECLSSGSFFGFALGETMAGSILDI